uniref:7TM GPCR serpentine receptor class x (Srx) domain-containing protein n=1 Tax=Panagrellus redivivus TaxID=6233 RepID=A0A7E4VP81_PANRE
MSPLFIILQINDYIASFCGFGLTLTLLIMILTEKNGELRAQNYIHNGVHYLMVTGFLRGYPDRNLGTFLIWFYIVTLATSVYIIPVPFFVRYLIICKGAKNTIKPMIACYIVVFGLTVLIAWIITHAYPMETEHNNALANAISDTFWVKQYGVVPIFAANYVRSWGMITIYIWGAISFTASYCVVVYFTIEMQREMKAKMQIISFSSHHLQIQKVLILQAIGPFITAVIPISILSFMVLFNLEQDTLLLSVATLFVWVSGINACAALFIVRPYRRRILRKICPCRRNAAVHSTSNFLSHT